ncbi:hypothetical protein O5D80_008637 [Batrachochytrium dendrobatidis]|nr:hypothetical protein O5D80_008637 [Batrachochytrium dendrobatidis]
MGYDNDSPPTHGSGQARPPGPHATRHFLVIGFSNVLGLAEAARLARPALRSYLARSLTGKKFIEGGSTPGPLNESFVRQAHPP